MRDGIQLISKLDYEISIKNLNIEKARLSPSATINYSKSENNDFSSTIDKTDQEMVKATVTWPIIKGGENISSIKKSSFNIKNELDSNIDYDGLVEKMNRFKNMKNIVILLMSILVGSSVFSQVDGKAEQLLDEVSRDLKNYDLEFRIEELESKFSKDLSESTFNELRELKKQKNY